jgi:hypothetical protein
MDVKSDNRSRHYFGDGLVLAAAAAVHLGLMDDQSWATMASLVGQPCWPS